MTSTCCGRRSRYLRPVELSVVIVNYNVRYFLEQCLLSVARAAEGLRVEVFVVDNASADGSVALVRERFPWVKLIANGDNPGFSRANNQAIRLSRGEFVLLLNPDTVVKEDTFRRCLSFARTRPDLGGLGVRMIDGSGRFLPESKRGLPTPWVAFTKAFGLARLFPRSRRFGHYHLGYLDEHGNHPVEVLSGAFMWMRRAALDRVGLLDEAFFMYGEDIDLSYRLLLGGWRNYYCAETSIIHYKGESTKRGSLNYVRVFYRAMIIFARKHFTGGQARLLVWMMQLAVYVRAALTLLANAWAALRFPLLDAVGIYLGLRLLKTAWSNYHFGDPGYFSPLVDYVHLPAYTLLWTGSLFLGGGYDRPYELPRLVRSLGVGTLILFAIYGLLPEELRPSRALLLLGATWAVGWAGFVRLLVHLLSYGNLELGAAEGRLLVVGGPAETERALSLLQRAGAVRNFLGRVSPGEEGGDAVGRADNLAVLVGLYRAEEVLFCGADLEMSRVQGWMSRIGPGVQYRILPEASGSIIGSHRSDRRGTLYTIDATQRISEPGQRRAKWLFDRGTALLVLVLSPLLLWFQRRPGACVANAVRVLFGRRSWVGYHPADGRRGSLPRLRPGVLYPGAGRSVHDAETVHHLNVLYARDYSAAEDWRILWANRRALGGGAPTPTTSAVPGSAASAE